MFDFTLRQADVVATMLIAPPDAPGWSTKPFLVWSMADAAAEALHQPDAVRAWQIVADLPPAQSPGKWLDGAAEMLSTAFEDTDAIVEFALHAPVGRNPHAHVLVSSMHIAKDGFGDLDPARRGIVAGPLKKQWLRWLRRYRP